MGMASHLHPQCDCTHRPGDACDPECRVHGEERMRAEIDALVSAPPLPNQTADLLAFVAEIEAWDAKVASWKYAQ